MENDGEDAYIMCVRVLQVILFLNFLKDVARKIFLLWNVEGKERERSF